MEKHEFVFDAVLNEEVSNDEVISGEIIESSMVLCCFVVLH